jgi:ethanolamine utilization protein EutA
VRLHDGEFEHFHEIAEEEKGALAEMLWSLENVELTTVGIDIGSSTSHLMFSRVHLQRRTQMLSSQFVVVSREVLWRSPILLTPFLPDFTIDAEQLRVFIDEAYRRAGLTPEEIDSGAVILTGEAIKRTNAQAIAQLFAADAGKFVCASAGHHMECVLAAHGAGATALSARTHKTVLNVDVGGGTTKLALIQNGQIIDTCALAVGGRLVALDPDGTVTRVEDSALRAAAALDLGVRLGSRPSQAQLDRLTETLSEVVVSVLRQEAPVGLAQDLLLTPPLTADARPHLITITGGVSEYVFGRESETFGDLAPGLAERVRRAFEDGRIPVPLVDPGQGIRATVIGASQFSVQVSGKTIHLSDDRALPVRNAPVVFPPMGAGGDFEAATVGRAIRAALARVEIDESLPVALGIRWHGDPHYARLRELAEGIARALGGASPVPLILMVDGDVAKLLGHILEHELGVARDIISIDGIQLREFDYVDIGEVLRPTDVVPVVIKSLLFPGH